MLAIPQAHLVLPLSIPEQSPTEVSPLSGGVLLGHALTTARFTLIQLCPV